MPCSWSSLPGWAPSLWNCKMNYYYFFHKLLWVLVFYQDNRYSNWSARCHLRWDKIISPNYSTGDSIPSQSTSLSNLVGTRSPRAIQNCVDERKLEGWECFISYQLFNDKNVGDFMKCQNSCHGIDIWIASFTQLMQYMLSPPLPPQPPCAWVIQGITTTTPWCSVCLS